jgi:hypothetical protein
MGNKVKAKSNNGEEYRNAIENFFKSVFGIDLKDRAKHVITDKNIYDDEISKLLVTKGDNSVELDKLHLSNNYIDNLILQYFRTVFCFTEMKYFSESFWFGLGKLHSNTSCDNDISKAFKDEMFKAEDNLSSSDTNILKGKNLILKSLNELFAKIFKEKELLTLFYLFDDIVFFIYFILLCLFDNETIKSFNEFTFSVITFEKKKVYSKDELIFVQNAYLVNLLTFTLFKKVTETGVKKCNLIFIEFENILSKQNFKMSDKDLLMKINSKLKNPVFEDFNNKIIEIYFFHTISVNDLNFLFTLDLISLKKYFSFIDSINSNCLKRNRKLYLIENEKNVLLEFLKNFEINRKTLINEFKSKSILESITILLNNGSLVFNLNPVIKEISITIKYKTIIDSLSDLKIDINKILSNFAENFLKFLSEILQISNKIKISIDKETNAFLKNSNTCLDLLNSEEAILKKCKIEFFINNEKKQFLEELQKDEIILDTDLLYLVNSDRRKSIYTFIDEKFLNFCADNLIELKYIKERFNFIVDNEHLQEKEYTARNIYNTLAILRNRNLEEEIFLNSKKIVDNKLIQKIFKVSLMHSLLNSTIIDTDEIVIVHGVFMRNFNNLLIKLGLENKEGSKAMPVKSILHEVFKTAKGCGLILLLINAKFSITYYKYTYDTINFIIKRYYTLHDNEVFACLFNNDNLYTINIHLFSRFENINEERKKCDFVNISIHLTNLPDDHGLLHELFTSLEIINNCLGKNFNKRNYFCLNYLFYNRKKNKSMPILQFSILNNSGSNELYINYNGFKKKIKNILKYNLINKCLVNICDKNITQCTRLNLNLNKYLVKNNQNYINTINILFQNQFISSSLKQSVINVNNSNFQLLSKAFQNNFVREHFTVGTIKLVDANIYEIINSVFQNDYNLENLEIIFEKSLNGIVSFEKIIAFNSNNFKRKDKLLSNLKKKRKNKITIHFNHNTHVEFIQEVYLMSNFVKFLKFFFDFIVLKGKAFVDIGKDLLGNEKFEKIFKFENNKFTQDFSGFFFALRNKFNKTYQNKEIMGKVFKCLAVKRNIKIELQKTKTSSLVFS